MNTLKMTADPKTGAFVKTLVNPTTGETGLQEGFHVHKSWFKKCLTFDQVMESLERSAEDREDLMVPLGDIVPMANDLGKFVFSVHGKEYVPTEWALSQFSTRLNLPSSSVMRELINDPDSDWQDADLAARIAMNSIRKADQDKIFRLRTYTDGSMRAFLTDKYAPVDNRWYMETVNEILPGSVYSHWRGDDDTIYGNVLLPDTIMDYDQEDDSDYGGMLSLSNCEIGRRKISQRPSLFRSICMNGCIWGEVKGEMIDRRHIGKIDLIELRSRITDNIEKQLPLIPVGVRKFLDLQNFKVTGSIKRALAGLCLTSKLDRTASREVLNQFVSYEKDERSLFGLVNAVTRAGQQLSNDSWVKLDKLAGDIVDWTQPKWDSFQSYSDSLTDKEVEEAFSAAAAQ